MFLKNLELENCLDVFKREEIEFELLKDLFNIELEDILKEICLFFNE